MRAFFDGSYKLTASHAQHLQRQPPSAGGEDWAVPYGTPLRAPFAGTVILRDRGTGGWTLTVTPSAPELAGLVVEVMHVAGGRPGITLNGPPARVAEGQQIGNSGGRPGDPGAGNSTGPHVHAHGILNGRRIAFTTALAWANERENMPTPAEIATAVWSHKVNRRPVPLPALQELADAKTIALRLEAKLDALLRAGGLSQAQLDAMGDSVADAVAAELAERLAE